MSLFRFASRTDWNLTPNKLARKVAELRRRGRELLDLTESNPTRCGFNYPDAAILGALAQAGSLSYDPAPKGLLAAREAVARYYQARTGLDLDVEHLVLTASTSEAYSYLFRLLAAPEENLLAPQPSYPLFDFLARTNDVVMKPYRLEYHDGWQVDLHSVEQALTPTTRALLVVNPNNPTGSGVHAEDRERLIDLCREHGLALISDEVFLDFEWPENLRSDRSAEPHNADVETSSSGKRLKSFAGEERVLTFCLSGISKMLALPQMKLAWIVASGPPAWLSPALERLEVIADTYLSVGTPVQTALPLLLDELRVPMREQILNRIHDNLRFLDAQVSQTHGTCRRLRAEGGWSAVVSIPRIHSEEEWIMRWLENDAIIVHPGYFFDFERPGYLVLSLIPPPHLFQEGVKRLFSRIQSELSR